MNHTEAQKRAIHAKSGFDSEKRWGNEGLRGHGINSPAMMKARKAFYAESKKKEDWNETTYGKKPTGKFYVSPTGSRHRIGSQKHKYWAAIQKRGEDNAKAGIPND